MDSLNRSSSSNLQDFPTLSDFPAELLIEIFSFLPLKDDLLSLTLTCKFFNKIVGDYFIDSLGIIFCNTRRSREWIGSRNYSRIHFGQVSSENFLHFANLIEKPEKVKFLSFNLYKQDRMQTALGPITISRYPKFVTNEILLSLLKIFKNVELLKVPNDRLEIPAPSELPALKLKKLFCSQYFTNVFELLRNSKVEEIYVQRSAPQNKHELEKFLLLHPEISSLILDFRHHQPNLTFPLFNGSSCLSKVDFKLKKLILISRAIEFKFNKFFMEFVRNFDESLNSLEVYDAMTVHILNFFVNVKSLKKVKFLMPDTPAAEFDPFNCLKVFNNIESLEVSRFYVNFDEKFPNLKKLKLSNFKLNSLIQIARLSQLEHLILENCFSISLTIPSSVKVLEFEGHDFSNPPEFLGSIGLKRLSIRNSKGTLWLGDFIREAKFELEILAIWNIEMYENFGEICLENREKIKRIRDRL